MKLHTLSACAFVALIVPIQGGAEEASVNFVSGLALQYELDVDLNFQVEIPELLMFRVGTDGNVRDTVVFDVVTNPPAPRVNETYNGESLYGNGIRVAATTNGTLEVEVIANSGTPVITTRVDNPSGLFNGEQNFIPYSEITCTSDNAGIPAPQLANVGIAPVTVTPNRYNGLVTQQTANWTYSYENTERVAAGRYVGVVTYTASVP